MQAAQSASNQPHTVGTAGGVDSSIVRGLQGSKPSDRSNIALPHRNAVSEATTILSSSIGPQNRTTQNQAVGSVSGRDVSSLRNPREWPQRGTRFNPTVTYQIDQKRVRFSPESIPYTRKATITPLPCVSHLTDQEQKRASRSHQYSSHIETTF